MDSKPTTSSKLTPLHIDGQARATFEDDEILAKQNPRYGNLDDYRLDCPNL